MNITKNIQVTFSVFSFAFISTFSMATCHTAYAQTTIEAHSSNSGLKATEQFQVGSMYVEKYANPNAKGAPVILIPGLSSGAYVWDETVKRLHNEHELYVITLAGFNGKPALVGPKFAKAKESLLELIQTRKIHQPVLVGHSLGSALSIWFAQSHSPLIRGVFGVDGLPVFPGTQNMSVAERSSMAEASRTQMGNVDQKTFA
ncbi:MAG: alpha/beta hydrolase, partial [Burkholderiaceae bacterium]|nr:alpha/beta hydrolase [Burkholderiaceae bacterium]